MAKLYQHRTCSPRLQGAFFRILSALLGLVCGRPKSTAHNHKECEMSNYLSPNEIERLRREAKQVSKAEGIGHQQALHRLARAQGHPNWDMLQRVQAAPAPRFPVFQRSQDEMKNAFRKVRELDGIGSIEKKVRQELPDLCEQFANPLSALEYGYRYMQVALSLPRYAPSPFSVSYLEMRIYLPYVLEPVPDQDDCFIPVGRDYKPLGMTQRSEHVDYGRYKNLHVRLPAAELARVTQNASYSAGYLYGVRPSLNRKYANDYLRQLAQVIELVARYER